MKYPKFITAPAIALIVLSPVIAELLSSASPPLEFFRPRTLIFLLLLYGFGSVLARELTVRWNGGWCMLLVLGAAYGIIEEGLMVKSFFDPGWPDLGLLGTYGRWAGVNWVWALFLTLYHAVFSVAVPVMLAGLMFPARRGRPWIARWLFWPGACVLAGMVALGYRHITPYRPPTVPYAAAALTVILLIAAASRLRPSGDIESGPKQSPSVRHRWFGLLGFLFSFLLMMTGMGLPHTGVHPLLTMALIVLLVVLTGVALWFMTRRGKGWSDRHKMALVSGALMFFVCLTPVYEMSGKRADDPAGMIYVGLVTALVLIALSRRIRKRAISGPPYRGQA